MTPKEICLSQILCKHAKRCPTGLKIAVEQGELVLMEIEDGRIFIEPHEQCKMVMVAIPAPCPRGLANTFCARMFVATREYAEHHGGLIETQPAEGSP